MSTHTYLFSVAIDRNGNTLYLRTTNTNATGAKLSVSFSYPVAENSDHNLVLEVIQCNLIQD